VTAEPIHVRLAELIWQASGQRIDEADALLWMVLLHTHRIRLPADQELAALTRPGTSSCRPTTWTPTDVVED
jgi:hypothetical protein